MRFATNRDLGIIRTRGPKEHLSCPRRALTLPPQPHLLILVLTVQAIAGEVKRFIGMYVHASAITIVDHGLQHTVSSSEIIERMSHT